MTATRSTLNGSAGSAEFLVDTNLLVYAFDAKSETKRHRAREVLGLLASSRRGALSTQVLGEFFVALLSKGIASPSQAQAAVGQYATIWPVLEIRSQHVLEATRVAVRYQQKYYVAMLLVTAKENSIPVLLSEDGQDGQVIEGVRRLNPFRPEFDLSQLS